MKTKTKNKNIMDGRLWQSQQPTDGIGPEEYEAIVRHLEKTRGAEYAQDWNEGVLCEIFGPIVK